MAHLGHGAVDVVGHGFHQHRHAVLAVALVGDLLHVGAVVIAGAALDRPVDGVLGHVVAERLVDGGAQARVVGDLRAAHAGRHGDFTNQLGEDLAPFGVLSRLTVLNIGPFTMTRHGIS